MLEILRYPEDKKILDKKVFFYNGTDNDLLEKVGKIINTVIEKGDAALCHYANKFDGVLLKQDGLHLKLNPDSVDRHSLHPGFFHALGEAIENITAFHRQQLFQDIDYKGKYGERLGQRFSPIDRVGVYVPGGAGGKTPLVSTLLMNVIPAQIAGVKKILVTTPPGVGGKIDSHLYYTLLQLGVEEVFLSGGAQAIAAMAYGTETLPEVDLIVGPGNRYVNTAKKLVFGKVMIDALSGHSEIVIWADGHGHSRPDWVAADLLSQAEHAGGELVVLLTEEESYANSVITEVNKQIQDRERKELIRSSLEKRGAVVLVKDEEVALEVIDHIAPEHIEVLHHNHHKAEEYAKKIKHAGAIFVGDYASEPIGDYICGTNHVLPTNRSARFSSPLGVYTFLKRTNWIEYNAEAFAAYSDSAAVLAEVENLTAHKHALEIRKEKR